MTEIIGVRFRNGGKIYYFSPGELKVEPEQPVIVETARGVEFGTCAMGNIMVEDREVSDPLRPVLRIAAPEDCGLMEANRKKEARAFDICQQKIAKHGLDMKLVDVEYNFEGSKILFFFTSDGRVDFRELVKDLASVFRTRIELRQIGVRDEAKMLGGLGICGQPFCCARFLEEFQPVSIKMAKTQSLSLNPAKISGACGRLMCCLKYEQEAYEDLLKRAPRADSFVETPDGVGTVSAVDLLRERVKVRLDIAPEAPHCYKNNEINIIRSGKGKRPEGYESPEVLLAAHIKEMAMKQAEETRPPEGKPLVREPENPSGEKPRPNKSRKEGQARRKQKEKRAETGQERKPGKKYTRGHSRPGTTAGAAPKRGIGRPLLFPPAAIRRILDAKRPDSFAGGPQWDPPAFYIRFIGGQRAIAV